MEAIDTLRNALFPGISADHTGIAEDGGGSRLMVNFSTGDTSSELHGLFTSTGLSGTLEGKSYRMVDTIFPILAGSIDRATGLVQQAPSTR